MTQSLSLQLDTGLAWGCSLASWLLLTRESAAAEDDQSDLDHLAVGGTAPTDGFPKPGSETAIGLSSGGFSGYWAQPEYQKSAVAGYLKTAGLPPVSRGYNTTGRSIHCVTICLQYILCSY